MSDPESFDFDAFMKRATTPDNDTRKAILQEGIAEEMDTVMSEVCPRVWQVLIKQMQTDPKNNLHLNAVINSALFATLSFIAACTPKGETLGRDNDEMLVEKVTANLKVALSNGRENASAMVGIAHNVGELKLLQDSNATLSKIVVSNSMVLQAVAAALKGA
jgi:hypothetical protein